MIIYHQFSAYQMKFNRSKTRWLCSLNSALGVGVWDSKYVVGAGGGCRIGIFEVNWDLGVVGSLGDIGLWAGESQKV